MSQKSILNYSNCKIYSRHGLNILGLLCVWQCLILCHGDVVFDDVLLLLLFYHRIHPGEPTVRITDRFDVHEVNKYTFPSVLDIAIIVLLGHPYSQLFKATRVQCTSNFLIIDQ